MLFKTSKISIGLRYAILSATILLLTIFVFVYISITEQRQNAINFIHSNTTNLGQSFERILRFSMQEYHREEIKNAIKGLQKTENIQTVLLSNHDGIIKYSTSELFLDTAFEIDHRTCSGCHLGNGDVLELIDYKKQFIYNSELEKTWTIIPVYNSKNCSEAECHIHKLDKKPLGVIEIVASTSKIEATLHNSHLKLILFSFIISLVVFIIFTYFNQKWISNPVKDLINGTKKVSLGNLNHTIPVGVAEFGELSESFNKMQRKLKEIQDQLICTEKLISIGKLSAGVAHEINNPLTGILSFIESLIMEIKENDSKKEDYEIIKNEVLRCRAIVKNLLDFTRQESLELKYEDINITINDTVEILCHQAKFSKINIIQDLNDSLPDILIDACQIKQVLLNLLINAAEAMPDGGTIALGSQFVKSNNSIEIIVKDTGKGIPENKIDKIFEPFFSTKGGKTNGLGLSISREIIKNHNGDFTVKSKPGEGSIFIISLPVLNDRKIN